MNIFFTCKNSLVILLQLYRLLVLIVKKRPQYRRHSLFAMFPVDAEGNFITNFTDDQTGDSSEEEEEVRRNETKKPRPIPALTSSEPPPSSPAQSDLSTSSMADLKDQLVNIEIIKAAEGLPSFIFVININILQSTLCLSIHEQLIRDSPRHGCLKARTSG